MASLYTNTQKPAGYQSKATASIYRPAGTGVVDVINDYTWTLTPPAGRKEIPSIILTEYQVNETTISRQYDFYTTGLGSGTFAPTDILSPYDSLFPKDQPTDFNYKFPFYSDVNFEVNTPQWASLDTLEAAKGAAIDAGTFLGGQLGATIVGKTTELLTGLVGAGLAANYPKVGIMDRPKLWQSHDFRTYTIKCPLYNTVNTDPNGQEWVKNRELCELLINQNLYNKLTFITGIPPVFYEVLIPGQHYSPAACVTNLVIYNRGNMRQFTIRPDTDSQGRPIPYAGDNYEYNVPDVYEINMTLTDLVIPSKNLFQAIQDKQLQVIARSR